MSGKKPVTPPLSELSPDRPEIYGDPKGKFAEIYGSALVGQGRLFVVVLIMGLVTLSSVIGLIIMARKSVAVPWYVEVSSTSGVVSKPVRVESITPSQAVLKAEMAKFCNHVFTIDRDLTPRYFKAANVLTVGAATGQFGEFRASENVLQRIAKEPELVRTTEITSVDASQPGVAFVFLTTTETKGTTANSIKNKWRVTLKYEIVPPQNERDILANPLGLYINNMNIIQEAAR